MAAAAAKKNHLGHHQETGGPLGVVTLVEPVGFVAVPETTTPRTIDGTVDPAWSDAPALRTHVQVEGTPGASAWRCGCSGTTTAIDAPAQVTDPSLDATSTTRDPQIPSRCSLTRSTPSPRKQPADGQ